MKLPESIKIGAHDIEILYPYAFKDVTCLRGQWCYESGTIKIRDKDEGGCERRPGAVLQTLLHELLHAVDTIASTHLFDGGGPDKEDKCDLFSEMLLQILVDNGYVSLKDAASD